MNHLSPTFRLAALYDSRWAGIDSPDLVPAICFVDLGAAFLGDGRIDLEGTCTETGSGQPCPGFQQELQEEEDEANQQLDDFGSFVKVHPILQLGFRIGL